MHAAEIPKDLISRVAPDGIVRSTSQLRHLLGAVERQATPSPLTVRFGGDDVMVRQFGDFSLTLDTADPSISAQLIHADVWEPATTEIFKEFVQPGMTVIDVGANVGWFTMLAASLVGPQGRVIAVEPWSENCRLLLNSIRQNGFDHVELWPVGLDRDAGWAHFMTHVGSNGGLIPDGPEGILSGRGTVIPVFALDDLLPDDLPVNFVKVDVEGAEYRVIQGGQKTLERWKPLVVSEFSLEMTSRVSGVDPVEYLRWFTTRGWELHLIDRETRALRRFLKPEDLLAWWPELLHQEDLLFLPE
jgi:FkbM family methyltransferase